jgi:hypothetical protein
MPDIDLNSREYFTRRVGALEKEFSSFRAHYEELSDNFSPRRGRFLIDDRNRGERKHHNIINSAGLQAARVSRSGLLAGIMSPARPWFALETLNPDFMENEQVKIWLHRVELLMRTIFNQSNLYNMAPTMLGETTVFGTGCMTQLDDFNDVARFYTHTVGSYMVAQNERYEIDTLVRQYMLTVHQMVKEFGLDRVSILVKDRWDRGEYDQWFPVTQVIEPNPNFDFDKLDAQFKPWRSVHFEPGNDKGSNINQNRFLRKSGFEEFPAFVPRWSVTGEDIYGTDCPGMIALGDNKGLQIEERRKAQAIDKMVNPPLRGPASLRNSPINTMPGGSNLYAGMPESKLEAIYQLNPQIGELKEDIQRTEARIQEAFYADMFLAISNMDGVQPRNQLELTQRNEERLLQLGPVLEQFHNEFLAKMIDRTFAQMGRAELLPPAPPALQGQPLKINFISSLARAQRAVAVGGIERLAGFAGQLAGAKPDVLDKIDADQMIDEYAQAIGTTPNLVVPDESVAIIRQQREQQAMAAQQMQMAAAAASAAKDAAGADMSGENLLSNAVNAAQG